MNITLLWISHKHVPPSVIFLPIWNAFILSQLARQRRTFRLPRFARYSSADGLSVLRSDQSLEKVASNWKDAKLNVLFDIRREFSTAGNEQRISNEGCHQPETDRDGGAGAVSSELFLHSYCANVLTIAPVLLIFHWIVCWQTKRVAQSEAGWVWLEGSTQSALQRYVYCLHRLLCCVVICCSRCTSDFCSLFLFPQMWSKKRAWSMSQ